MSGTANEEIIIKKPGLKKAKYGTLIMGEDENGKAAFAKVGTDGKLAVAANINVGDVEIGAVEIKDGTSDNRVTVDSNGALKVTGGASSVNAEYKSPDDFSATYTSSTTITLSGLPFTIADSSQVQYITVVPSSGDAETYVNGANGITITVNSNVLTISGVSTPFASGDVYQVGLNSQKKAYDPSTNSGMVSQLNTDYNHYTSTEHLIDSTNVDAGTNRVVFDFESFKHGVLQLKGSGGVTFTLFATLDDTADDSSDAGWVDVTNEVFGAASIVDSEVIGFIDTAMMPDRFMVKYVTSDSSNAVDAWIKKGY